MRSEKSGENLQKGMKVVVVCAGNDTAEMPSHETVHARAHARNVGARVARCPRCAVQSMSDVRVTTNISFSRA